MPIECLHMTDALSAFANATSTQDQGHIKPLHQHLAMRLVLEGGYLPDEVTPHPPLQAKLKGGKWLVHPL